MARTDHGSVWSSLAVFACFLCLPSFLKRNSERRETVTVFLKSKVPGFPIFGVLGPTKSGSRDAFSWMGSGGQMGLVLSTVVGDISGSYGVLRWIAQRGFHKMNTIE